MTAFLAEVMVETVGTSDRSSFNCGQPQFAWKKISIFVSSVSFSKNRIGAFDPL